MYRVTISAYQAVSKAVIRVTLRDFDFETTFETRFRHIRVLGCAENVRVIILDLLFKAHGPLSFSAVATLDHFFDMAISEAADAFTQKDLQTRTEQLTAERDAAAQNADTMATQNASVAKTQRETAAELHQAQNDLTKLGETSARTDQFLCPRMSDARTCRGDAADAL